MIKKEIIKLINFFNKIEIEEEDVTTPEEKARGQLVLIVTYKFEGNEYKTNKLYYKEVDKDESKNVIDYFGSPVFWLDMDKHDWPSKDANLNNTIVKEIAQSGDKTFKEFLLSLANDSKGGAIFEVLKDGYWANYHFNLLNNNHWHDIVKLIQAFINSKGRDINKKYFSKLVFRWEQTDKRDKRSSLSTHFGGRRFINELQKNLKMVEPDLQHEKMINLLKQNYQIVLQGPPGTGKTKKAKELAYFLITDEELPADETERRNKLRELSESGQYKLIQFHPSYSYEDFVRGITAEAIDGKILYRVENKVLAEMALKASKSGKPYVLIIDEINRANLPSVFGELIYALEYRGEEVESMYGLGKENNRKMVLPTNLFIIGTMNTADRSVGSIDYALRRRFIFETILPNRSVVSADAKDLFKNVLELFVKDAGSIETGNARPSEYVSPDFSFGDVILGHSYFIGNKETVRNKLEHQVKPLLIEYIKDGVLKEAAKPKVDALEI